MSDIELSASVGLAAESAYLKAYGEGLAGRICRARAYAAAEAAVREQIARDIEAESAKRKQWAAEAAQARGGVRSHHDDGFRMGLDAAASIVRGVS